MNVNRPLPDGLLLRTAEPADLAQISALLAARGDPVDAVDHKLIMTDPDAGWSTCTVVVDGDRVVSTATLLDETLWLAGVSIPAGQVELVATDPEYEGRGLVRALMSWLHERSAARGHLVQLIIGIPYFYRQFGYSYAIPLPTSRPLASSPPAAESEVVREAATADIPAMDRLQVAAQARAELRLPRSANCWRWLVEHEASRQWLVERDGVPVATGRTARSGDTVRLAELAASDPAATYALVQHAGTLARGTPRIMVYDRPGSVAADALAPFLGPAPERPQRYYVRAPDPAALLALLRPVLSARLADSPLRADSGELELSFYRSHVRLPYADGEVGEPVVGGVRQWFGENGAAVPPDLVPALLFGVDGFTGLARVHPDVAAGAAVAPLLAVLFPPVDSDLLTYYLP